MQMSYRTVLKSDVWNGSHWTKIKESSELSSILEALGENSLFICLFQLVETTCTLWSLPSPPSKPEMADQGQCLGLIILVSFWPSSLDRVASNPSRITDSSVLIIILLINPRRQKWNKPPSHLLQFPPLFSCPKFNLSGCISYLIDTLIYVNIHVRQKRNTGMYWLSSGL